MKRAGKHSPTSESPDKIGFTTELERDDEDNLLWDDDMNNPPLTTSPVASAKANDTLESTLLKINDMLSVSKSMRSVQESLARFANGQRPAKRQRVDEMSDSDIDIDTNNASDSDSDTLLKKGEE